MNRDIRPNEDSIFNAILHAYTTKNNQYPEKFDTYIATQYFNKTHQKEEDLDRKNSEWLNQKINEVEKHLERISVVKLQLTKNIKELESQWTNKRNELKKSLNSYAEKESELNRREVEVKEHLRELDRTKAALDLKAKQLSLEKQQTKLEIKKSKALLKTN